MTTKELIKEKESILKNTKDIIQRDIVKLSLEIHNMEFNEYVDKVNTVFLHFGQYAERTEKRIESLKKEL